MVQAGDCVNAGDEILKLDLDSIQTVTEQLENEINILNLKINNLSYEIPSADTKMLQLAENNLRYAQADYVQLVAALEAAGVQVEQDLKEAQNRYHQELNDLEKAKVQAKEEGIETAENGLDAAEKALGDAEYSRGEAVSAAQKSLSEAESVYSSAKSTCERTAGELAQAGQAFQEAEEALESLGENATDEERAEAKEATLDQWPNTTLRGPVRTWSGYRHGRISWFRKHRMMSGKRRIN